MGSFFLKLYGSRDKKISHTLKNNGPKSYNDRDSDCAETRGLPVMHEPELALFASSPVD